MIAKKMKLKCTAAVLISVVLFSGYSQFLSNYINGLNLNPKPSPGVPDSYLYLDEVNELSYDFRAQGPGYIFIEIDNVDFTSFMLDGETYEVSYGFNVIPVAFSNNPYKIYTIEITPQNLQFFKTITVEPLFVAEDEINVNLNQDTEVNFHASGPISILTRINFSYNWLKVELKNQNGNSTILKRIHDTTEYPEIDPLFYCLFMERGTYIRYDVNVEPGEYTLLFQGDGFIEYKIIVNSDWDSDMLNDVDEAQQSEMYQFDLDPTSPDIWGFFEKSCKNLLNSSIEEEGFTEGYFSFYIPEIYINNTLSLQINSGTFTDVVVDMDSLFFEGETLMSDRNSPSSLHIYGDINSGWHHISYQHKANYSSDIEFLITNNLKSNQEVKVIEISEFRDTDGDGVKDLEEYPNSLNPAKSDTDEDGVSDNLDGSPLAKLELDPNQIHQFVLSVNESRDTLINIQIKKPENDYSTNGVPRLWRGAVNVSIYPVLRLFGNRHEDLQNPGINVLHNMDKPMLEFLWDKDVDCIFKSDTAILTNYDENVIGDPLPNPNNPDSEFFFIFPKSASETFDYDIMIPEGHSSKEDGLLDLRLDFIWLLTEYDHDTEETSVLHYYDFEESIVLQSMVMREISNVHYTLGNPDCFIENQILWTLTQNPILGSFEDYGVDDDVELSGVIDYFGLSGNISEYRANVDYEPDSAEVLYMKGFYQNYDILNQIYVKTLENPDLETLHQGNYSVCFSSYSISNRYEDQAYFLGNPEIQGETKILYQIYPSADEQHSRIIMGIPIAMERSVSAHTLKISQIQGFLNSLGEIPWVGSQLSDTIAILHQTFIERNIEVTGIPLVHFEEGIDVYKEHIDNRQEEVELSHLFFTAQPVMPAELFINYIEVFWEQLALMRDNISLLYDFVSNNSDFFIPGSERVDLSLMEKMINDITEFQQLSYSKMSSYSEFFQFSQNFYGDAIELVNLYFGKESKNLVSSGFFKKLSKVVKLTKVVPKIAKFVNLFSRLGKNVNHVQVKDIPKQNIVCQGAKNPSIKAQEVKTHYRSRVMGVGCTLLGIAMVFFAIVEINSLASGNRTDYQGVLAINALCNLIGSFFLFTEGVLLITSSFAKSLASSLKSTIKSIGKVSIVLSVLMLGLNLYKFIDRVNSGQDVDLVMEIFGLAMSTSAIVVALAVALGFCSTGVGAIIGAAIAAVSILFSWVTKYINAPDLEFLNADCRTYFPDSTIINMRRNGGLERSDQFVYYLKVRNTGKNRVWMRARLRMAGDTLFGGWTSWLGDWADGKNKDGYKEDEVFSQYFVASIDDATPNLKYELQFEADWRHWYAFVPVREDLTDQEWLVPMNMHALENSISEFYAFTSDYGSVSELKRQYEEALEEYRYWDACNIAETIIKATEVNSGISLSYFNHLEINSNGATVIVPMVYAYDVYKYQTTNLWEWEYLLTKFYAPGGRDGWAAWERPDDPTYKPPTDWGSGMLAPRTRSQPDTFEWNMMSYDESNGILYTTADPIMGEQWMENKRLELSDAYIYRELIDNLPIKSNLSTDLRKQRIEVDPVSGIAEVHLTMNIDPWHNPYYTTTYPFFPFILIGRDGDKIVEFQITAPEGYSIGPQSVFTDYLLSTISFNLSTDTPKLGVYFFNISVFFEGDLIYKESVPFKVGGFSCMEFEYFTPTDPIVPGQMFTLVDMYNLGTFTEILNVTTDGFPEDFIYSDIYPIGFIENCAFVALNPGEAMPGLIIKPPRHYTTTPGIYSYKFRARDNVSNNFDEIMEGIFEVAEFYDLNLICADPEKSIFDYEVAVYNFILTNLGNVNQEFNISVDDIPFAERSLSHESIYLGPGESQSFTLNLTPIGWGEQIFSINVTSDYNSSLINAKIIIMDDDLNSPLITNFEILNTSIDVTVNFEVLNEFEGDDYGLSMIRIFIDDELVLDYIPLAIETNFSFTFDSSHGDWFMENGTHEIRVEIFDNDFDVPDDSLNYTISGTFKTTLLNMYCYVDWQLETLKKFIDDNIDSCHIRSWNCMLTIAQWQLEKAFDYVYNASITCGLFHDAVAKVLVQIVIFKTEIFEKLDKIDENIGEFIINSTCVIRDNIILLMGYTTGMKIGLQIALIEIDLLNLCDFIEAQMDKRKTSSLKHNIRVASYNLETALFKISKGYNIECCMLHALYKLENAECKVHWLVCKGWITQELADTILSKLTQAQEEIGAILNVI